ncbi:MAG: hypothetical protein [Microvirus sp.]|nr:MAG: hypothetical protein [Microvirus sp.]
MLTGRTDTNSVHTTQNTHEPFATTHLSKKQKPKNQTTKKP